MTPYEILLSESQERMLVVAKQGPRGRRARDPREVGPHRGGHRRGDRRAGVSRHRGRSRRRRVPRHPPRHRLPDVRARGARERRRSRALRERDVHAIAERPEEARPALDAGARCSSSPTIASKRWVYRQYDHTVRTSTVIGPGGDAAVVRIRGTDTAIALKTDCNGRYVYLDPARGRAHRGGRGGAQRRLRRRAADGDHEQPQLRQPEAARGLLPAPRGGRRDGRGVRGARHAGHGRQRLALQREPARRGVSHAGHRHGRARRLARARHALARSATPATRSCCSARTPTSWAAASISRASTASSPGAPPRVRPRRASARSSTRCSRRSATAPCARRTTAPTAASPSRSPSACMMDRAQPTRRRRRPLGVGVAAAPRAALRRGTGPRRRLDADPDAVLAIAARHGVPARVDRRGDADVRCRFTIAVGGSTLHRRRRGAGRRLPRSHPAHHVAHRVARRTWHSPHDSQV